MAFTRDGEHYVVIASKGGSPTSPDWYHNLVANPSVIVEVGAERFMAIARVSSGEERERLYAAQAAFVPGLAEGCAVGRILLRAAGGGDQRVSTAGADCRRQGFCKNAALCQLGSDCKAEGWS